jgi:hypothetical protein
MGDLIEGILRELATEVIFEERAGQHWCRFAHGLCWRRAREAVVSRIKSESYDHLINWKHFEERWFALLDEERQLPLFNEEKEVVQHSGDVEW